VHARARARSLCSYAGSRRDPHPPPLLMPSSSLLAPQCRRYLLATHRCRDSVCAGSLAGGYVAVAGEWNRARARAEVESAEKLKKLPIQEEDG